MQQLKSGSFLQEGKYKIEKVLGQGGFGITYLATQELLDRKVCIKEFFFKEYCERDEATSHVSLGTQSNHEIVERFMTKFLKEARTISQLDHRNIIKIYDIFKENNTAYYVMEFIEGESLADKVNRNGALPETEAVEYIKQVASALDFIHRQSINHLDVKPANIMIRRSDNKAVLIDFGLSKQYDEQGGQTSTTPVGISHGYAPMEQYKQGGVSTFSPQTDIYALGATLYKLVTGNTPPQAMDILDEGVLSLPSSVSPSVAEALKKAMQPRKVDRPNSVEEFISRLKTVSQSSYSTQNETVPLQNHNDDDETKILSNTNTKTEIKRERIIETTQPKIILDSADDVNKKEKKGGNKVGCSLFLVLSCFILFFVVRNCDDGGTANVPIEVQSPTTESLYNEACTYYEKKDYSNAIPLLEQAANMGYAPAQALLGHCYYEGVGVAQNDTIAFKWTKKAADQNEVLAFFNLGVSFYFGNGVEQNKETAVYWWNRAAHEGDVSAQYNIGLCYYYGDGVTKDVVKAKEWFEKAASQGNGDAKKFLKENDFRVNTGQKKSSLNATINTPKSVDLGLSVKWADRNVGASSPTDYGNHFAWGEISTKSKYTKETSLTYGKEINDIVGNLQYDAARANWGGKWRLPTKAEIEELNNKCTWERTTQGGINGYKVIGPNGNSIFLPFSGHRYDTLFYGVGTTGGIWSSSPYDEDTLYPTHYSCVLCFDNQDRHYWGGGDRDLGRSIRPVLE